MKLPRIGSILLFCEKNPELVRLFGFFALGAMVVYVARDFANAPSANFGIFAFLALGVLALAGNVLSRQK